MSSEIKRITDILQNRADDLLVAVRRAMGDDLKAALKRMNTVTTVSELRAVITKGDKERENAIFNRTTHRGRSTAAQVSKAMKAALAWDQEMVPIMARLNELTRKKIDVVVIVIDVQKDETITPEVRPTKPKHQFVPSNKEMTATDREFLRSMRIAPDSPVPQD